jgi:hypothetical protein
MFLLLSCNLLLFSCKKGSPVDDMTDVIVINEGLLRVECGECEIKYTINKKEFKETIKDGNVDLSFSYQRGYNLQTQIISKKEQSIRLLVLNAQGHVISNELTPCSSGEIRNSSFDLDKN